MNHPFASSKDENLNNTNHSFRLIVPPHTPLHSDGSLNLEPVEAQARLFADWGVHGVFVAGSTGEGLSLTIPQRKQLAERWLEVARPLDLQVMVQIGHTCQQDAIELARHAARLQADAVATAAPSYFKPATVDDLVEFCRPVAEAASGIKFYFYDIPRLTNVALSMPEFLVKGKRHIPNLAGIKFTNVDLVQLQECLGTGDDTLDILFGCDQLLLPARALGVTGAIGSTYNFAAPLYLRMIEAFDDGDLAEARRLQARSVAVIRCMETYGFLAATKAAMKGLGINCGPVLPPLRSLTPQQELALREQLVSIGVP